MISIMMINYNGTRFIRQAIESVLNQSRRDYELIIQDDCSTDDSWEICESYQLIDSRIRIFRNEQRLGTAGNRAAAFSSASGELVCHLDSDDKLYPWSLEVMAQSFVETPQLAFAYSDCALIDADGNVAQYRRSDDFRADLSGFGWRHFGMYRRDAALGVGGYNTKLSRSCEDGDLVMKIADRGGLVKRVPHVLYQHRFHGTHQSSLAGQCGSCTSQSVCDYYQIWSRHASRVKP